MKYSSGTCSGLEKGLIMDERKRKRKEANRESARRSRQRKQQQLEDLKAQEKKLREANNQMSIKKRCFKQQTESAEIENSVLMSEKVALEQRLQYLNEILSYINSAGGGGGGCMFGIEEFERTLGSEDGFVSNSRGLMGSQKHPIMASAAMFDY